MNYGHTWLASTVFALLAATAVHGSFVTNITSGGAAHLTLSAALAAAAPGDTLLVRSNVFNESPDINKNIIIRGGYNPAFTTQNGISIITNGGGAGSVIDVTGGVSVQLEMLRLQGGSVSAFGGGLDVRAGSTVVVNRCQIRQCRSNLGGGLYARDFGTLVIVTNTEVRLNTATTLGGGIRVYGDARVIATGASSIQYNSAPDGGGVAVDGAVFELIDNAYLMHNVAATRGGGVLVENQGVCRARGVNTRLGWDGNLANRATNGSGGGVYAVDARVELREGASVVCNEASELGGGIFLSNSVLEAEHAYCGSFGGSMVAGATNWAGLYGGGLYAVNSQVRLSNVWVGRGAAMAGAGVFVQDGLLEAHDCRFGGPEEWAGNVTYGGGGGVYAFGATTRLVNVRMEYNRAQTGFGGGGAIFGNAPLVVSNAYVQGNKAWQYGGLYFSPNYAAAFVDVRILSNQAALVGGLLAQFFRSNRMERCVIRDNAGVVVGGAYVVFSQTGEVVGVQIYGNVASNHVGGAYIYGNPVTMRDCVVYGNVADADGDGDGDGGGMYVAGKDVRLVAHTAGIVITNNRASRGGGIYAEDPQLLQLEGHAASAPILLAANTASNQGGGLALFDGATARVYGAVLIVSNTALAGGGVLVSNIAAFIARPTNNVAPELRGNIATAVGGGAAVYGGAALLDVLNVRMAANRAYSGGAVFASKSGRAVLINAAVENNQASNIGGGVLAVDSGDVVIDSDFSAAPPSLLPPSRFIKNHAGFEVGGIYAQNGSRVLVKNTLVMSNTAVGAAGGFGALLASGQVVNTIFAHNTAGTIDAVGFQTALQAVLQHCTIVDNGAIGVWSQNTTPTLLENTIVWGHTNSQIIDAGVTSTVNYCAIEGGYLGLFNITNYPEFVNRAGLDFQLHPASPCIDKGATLFTVVNDCIGETRPYGLGWDIGAYEFVPEPAGLAMAMLALLLARGARRPV